MKAGGFSSPNSRADELLQALPRRSALAEPAADVLLRRRDVLVEYSRVKLPLPAVVVADHRLVQPSGSRDRLGTRAVKSMLRKELARGTNQGRFALFGRRRDRRRGLMAVSRVTRNSSSIKT
jgi:hypothetical protein